MSNRYKGAVISATPPTTTGGESGTASGVWTLEQQMQLTAASLWPLQPTLKFIEDVFSTFLYTGTGALQTITNGIDLSTKGGLVWLKSRSATYNHYLQDTTRGIQNTLTSNDTSAQSVANDIVNSVSTTGFVVQSYSGGNNSGSTYASWTFAKQPKFFDVVTWTGTGANRTIAHSLGSVPGSIIVKRLDTTAAWAVYHRSLANTEYLVLNSTAAAATGATWWNSTTPTSSVFSVGTDASVNASGGTYVAYIFAHNAGGFGLLGTDNVISCGTWTEDGTTQNINLGYEPQFLIVKLAGPGTSDWFMFDTMRGWPNSGTPCPKLSPNTTAAEIPLSGFVNPTATGFTAAPYDGVGQKQIYIAIRRGPMKVPTLGTSVFAPVAQNASANAVVTTNFPVDLSISAQRSKIDNSGTNVFDRLRGTSTTRGSALQTDRDTSEYVWTSNGMGLANNTALIDNFYNPLFGITSSIAYWNFRRAPSFFDEVCYTGTGVGTSQTHNLGVIPELKIIKSRSGTVFWVVGGSIITGVGARANNAVLNTDAAVVVNAAYWDVADTSTTFSVRGNNSASDTSGTTYVAYLFATCAGVSKVGSYTGTGTTQTINCGFTAGSRFVMIKRTDSTGDWYVWDSARGIVAGNDPYLLLNSTAAEVTGTDYIDTANSGFEISSTAPAAINASAGTFIFLAIA